MTKFHLAQMNVATMRYPKDDPRVAEFFERIDEINAIADASPGFVWRLQDESGNATAIETDDPYEIVNMSVWESVDALFAYVYRSDHKQLIAKRKDWFERPTKAFQALWWIPAGHTPSVDEGLDKLRRLDANGPTADAFTFKTLFPSP